MPTYTDNAATAQVDPNAGPRLIRENPGSDVTFVEGVGFANVQNGDFMLTLLCTHWTPVAGLPEVHPDLRVVSRLRFNEHFAKDLYEALGKMIALNAKPEGPTN